MLVHKKSKKKTLWTFSGSEATIEPLSSIPSDRHFLSFRIVDPNTNNEVNRFKAENIVQMRNFMASLGARGSGLFTKQSVAASSSCGLTDGPLGLWDVVHPAEGGAYEVENIYENQTWVSSTEEPPLYEEAIKCLPQAFYQQHRGKVPLIANSPAQSGTLPVYDASSPPPKQTRRTRHDVFLPPYGPPVLYPLSLGYGEEVGLPPGIQALWDPEKKYYFIDHEKKISFTKDPRPQKKESVIAVRQQSLKFRDGYRETTMTSRTSTNATLTTPSAERALRKHHGFVLQASGVRGSDGVKGFNGDPGNPGISLGIDGTAGKEGGPGSRGGDGTPGSDVILHLSGNAEALVVQGTCSFTAKLGGPQAEEVLFVNCRGGDGGDGGVGGAGGMGGQGGVGILGSPGIVQGSAGGNGGPGGNGGKGGKGGRGGDGGHASFGGKCLLKTSNPKLLILAESDCRAGVPGRGGKGGKGGEGGEGGCGGAGGIGGPGYTTSYYDGRMTHTIYHPPGPPGLPGPDGDKGAKGQDGPAGKNGQTAAHGGTWWVILSPEGTPLYEAQTRYDVKLDDRFSITSKIPDGIFEPNEEIFISNITAINVGGLPLPAGARVFMTKPQSINFKPIKYEMPALNPNTKMTIPTTFCGRIFDSPPPNSPGPLSYKATFQTRAELLGRQFDPSIVSKVITVQYPVKLRYLKCSENAGRGEISILKIGVSNISNTPYGNVSGTGGKVALRLRFDSRLIPIGWGNGDKRTNPPPYTVTYDPKVPNSMYVELKGIPPGKYIDVKIAVQMCTRSELFDRCYWQADLYLRDKLIEYNFESVRISPFYVRSNPPADVLMVTSKSINRKEFVYWQTVFEQLNLSVDFWDTGRYNGFSMDKATNSRHPTSWIGQYTGRLILYPHCELENLLPYDIAYHFHGMVSPEDALRDLNSSMVLFLTTDTGDHTARKEISVLRHLATAQPKLEVTPNSYSGRHFLKPDKSRAFLGWEKDKLRSLEKENPTQMSVVLSRLVQIEPTSKFRYTYGKVDIRKIPLMRSCKFMVIDGAGTNMAYMSIDDANLDTTSSEIPLASYFGQVFISVLFGLSLEKKLEYIKEQKSGDTDDHKQLSFYLPNGYRLTCGELSMICLSVEIADEVYTCERSAHRMEKFAEDVEANMSTYKHNGLLVMQGLKLIKKEVKQRKKKMKHSDITKGADEILKIAGRLKKTLKMSGVEKLSKTDVLPRLDVLRDSERFHHSHQYKVSDNKWNLF